MKSHELPKNWRKTLGDRMAALRLPYTQEEFAKKLDISIHQLGEYERGNVSKPNAEIYIKAATALGHDPSIFFHELSSSQTTLEDIITFLINRLPSSQREDAIRITQVLKSAIVSE